MTVCQTAAGGLQEAKDGGYSLILLDVIMPDMDGFTVLRELKATELTKYVPVILLTSLADIQYEEKGLLMGAVDYVAKPFSPVIIKARVNTHIQLYHYQTDDRRSDRDLQSALLRGGQHRQVAGGGPLQSAVLRVHV